MTNREQAMETMLSAVKQELTANSAIYSANQDYKTEADNFFDSLEDHEQKKLAAHADNSGFSQDKLNQKIKIANTGSNLSGKAFVKFKNLNMLNLAEQLHTEPTDYLGVADGQCSKLAEADYKIMNDQITILSATGTVTPAMLVDYKKDIDKFNELHGTSETVHAVSPQLTKEFKDSYKPLMVIIENLKYLTRDYKNSEPEYYKNFMASTVIPVINVHHTFVEVHATYKISKKPVEGMLIKLDNTTKTATTDWEGNGTIEEVKAGAALLEGELASKVKFSMHVYIARGKTNHFDVDIMDEE